MKPKYTVKNFNKDNIYFLRGMMTKDIAGRNVLTSGYYTYESYGKEDIADLDDISTSKGHGTISLGGNNNIWYLVSYDGGIFLTPRYPSTQENYGEIASGQYSDGDRDDILVTGNDTFLYTGAQYLGYGKTYTLTENGTSTTVDFDGTNLAALGVDDDCTIYNYSAGDAGSKGEEYTVTGLSGGKTISGVSDYSGTESGTVLINCIAHGLETGDTAYIRNTTDYNGSFTVTKVNDDSFYIIETYTSSQNGNLNPDVATIATATDNPASGDVVTIFNPEMFSFFDSGYDYADYDIQYKGQPVPLIWDRQIKFFQGDYYVSNGIYLAKLTLSNDDANSVWDYSFKEMPEHADLSNGGCFEVNDNKMLLAGQVKDGSSYLVTWDGYKDEWIYRKKIKSRIVSIAPFDNEFIYLDILGDIYYTDGETIRKITTLPSSIGNNQTADISNISQNALTYWNNKILVPLYDGVSYGSLYRTGGIWMYDIEQDMWSNTIIDSEYYGYSPKNSISSFTSIWDDSALYYATTDSIGYFKRGSNPYAEVFLKIDLPEKMKINQIELSLSFNETRQSSIAIEDYTKEISVSAGDGKRPISISGQLRTGSTTTVLKPGSNYVGYVQVGDEIEIVDSNGVGASNNCMSEQRFVTSIANSGESTEEITISPALSAAPSSDSDKFFCYGLRKCDTRDVEYGTPNPELKFNVPDFYGSTLWLHIRIDGSEFDINQISIY